MHDQWITRYCVSPDTLTLCLFFCVYILPIVLARLTTSLVCLNSHFAYENQITPEQLRVVLITTEVVGNLRLFLLEN